MRQKNNAVEPFVSVEEIKAHLRIEGDEESPLLKWLLLAAEAAAANFCVTDFSGELPEPVRLAILLHAGHFYTYREGGDAGAHDAMIKAFHALLWPYREAANLF